MTKNKSKIIYPKENDRKLNCEELNAKDIQELRHRLDFLTIELYSNDSKCALKKIPELEERLDNLANRIAMNDNELRIYRDAVYSLQSALYPLSEAYELQKMKNKIRQIHRISKKEQRKN